MTLSRKRQGTTEENFVVSFKGDFLDQLIDAKALLEVASKLIVHHQDVGIDHQTFTGLALLMGQIQNLLDINNHLLPDHTVVFSLGENHNSEMH